MQKAVGMKSCQVCSSNSRDDRNIKAAHETLTFCLYVTYDSAFNWSHAIAQIGLFTPKYSYSCLPIYPLIFFSDLLCMLCVERHKNNVFEIYTLKMHVHWTCGTDSEKTKRHSAKSLAYVGHLNLQIS